MPAPSLEISVVTSCRPVPAAATTPIFPRRTELANAMGAPFMIAVPQSGPITSSPFFTAAFFRATSVSRGTLSEKSITFRPFSRQSAASAPAKRPATEMTARLAPSSIFMALSSPAAFLSEPEAACAGFLLSSSSAVLKAASRAPAVAALTAMARSLSPAFMISGVSRPEALMIPLFSLVAITTAESSTPGTELSFFAICISETESKYAPFLTIVFIIVHPLKAFCRENTRPEQKSAPEVWPLCSAASAAALSSRLLPLESATIRRLTLAFTFPS